MVFSFSSANVANYIIHDGIDIGGLQVRGERLKQEPIQCLKCRGWEHKAQDCTVQTDICGTCRDNHHTGDCTIKDKLYCASCKTEEHVSWDRKCPEFKRHCEDYDRKFPENNFIYFPTPQEWTLTTKPDRIPLEKCFPQSLAAKSIPNCCARLGMAVLYHILVVNSVFFILGIKSIRSLGCLLYSLYFLREDLVC